MHRYARLLALIGTLVVACSPGQAPRRSATTARPEPPSDLAAAAFWVAVEEAQELVLVDAEKRRVVRRISVPGRPHNLTVTTDGTVAATLQRAGTVALVRDGSVSAVELGGSPHDVKPTGDGLVIANEGSRRLDLLSENGEHTGSIALQANPHDVAVRGDIAWVSMNGTDQMAIVELDAREVARYIRTGKRPHDLVLAEDGRAWLTDWNGTLHVFDKDGQLLKTITLGDEAHHLAFTPDGDEVWVTDHGSRRVYVVSASTSEVVDSMAIAGAPHHVGITSDGRLAAVADHSRGTLVLFDVSERREVATISVGPGPHGVWPSSS